MAIASYILATGSTWKTASISSGTDWTFTESGSPVRLAADGSRSVQLVCIDQKVATITVNGLDPSLVGSSEFRAGTSGALVLKARPRGAGDTNNGTIKTFTFAEAVLVSVNPTAPNDGNGTISLSFEAYDSDDNSSIFAVT